MAMDEDTPCRLKLNIENLGLTLSSNLEGCFVLPAWDAWTSVVSCRLEVIYFSLLVLISNLEKIVLVALLYSPKVCCQMPENVISLAHMREKFALSDYS